MYSPRNTNGKLEWFNGDKNALLMYRYIADLAHIWDDLIDKDNPVNESDINYAFSIPLVILPSNPFYRSIQDQITPLWVSTIMAYRLANDLERDGKSHGIEISHGLRYAAGNIISYALTAIWGADGAAAYMKDVWLDIMPERFNDYLKEHEKCE